MIISIGSSTAHIDIASYLQTVNVSSHIHPLATVQQWLLGPPAGRGLEHDLAVLALVYDVLRETLEELWIFALVDGAENGRGRPTTRIYWNKKKNNSKLF